MRAYVLTLNRATQDATFILAGRYNRDYGERERERDECKNNHNTDNTVGNNNNNRYGTASRLVGGSLSLKPVYSSPRPACRMVASRTIRARSAESAAGPSA